MLKTLHGFGLFGESLVAGLAVALSIFATGVTHAVSAEPAFSVLLFSKTAGYRHDSISYGIAAIRALGEQNNFRVDASEDAAIFNDEVWRSTGRWFFQSPGISSTRRAGGIRKFVQRGGDLSASMRPLIPIRLAMVRRLLKYFRRHP
jgi:hypothetical protein